MTDKTQCDAHRLMVEFLRTMGRREKDGADAGIWYIAIEAVDNFVTDLGDTEPTMEQLQLVAYGAARNFAKDEKLIKVLGFTLIPG